MEQLKTPEIKTHTTFSRVKNNIYHRGQIVTIAPNAGINEDIPMGDYSAYLMLPED